MRNNSRPAWVRSTQAFISEVTCWRSKGLLKLSQGGGVLTVYGLILGHVLWKDFAQLGDEEALEFLSVIITKISKNLRSAFTKILRHLFQTNYPPNTDKQHCRGRYFSTQGKPWEITSLSLLKSLYLFIKI